jgi:hypothetical protein
MNDANEKTQMNRRHTIMTIANLANLASRAPTAYELLHRFGLERRRSRAIRAASCAGWIGVGMAVGSGLTLLFTPRTGPQMREHLGERAKRARDYVVTNGIEPAGRASAAQAP